MLPQNILRYLCLRLFIHIYLTFGGTFGPAPNGPHNKLTPNPVNLANITSIVAEILTSVCLLINVLTNQHMQIPKVTAILVTQLRYVFSFETGYRSKFDCYFDHAWM